MCQHSAWHTTPRIDVSNTGWNEETTKTLSYGIQTPAFTGSAKHKAGQMDLSPVNNDSMFKG